MRSALLLLTCLVAASAHAQAPPPEASGNVDDELICATEHRPVLIGGLEALQARVVYPTKAWASGVEGRVFVRLVVNEDGSVSELEAIRSPSPLLSAAAMDAVRTARFEPGMQRGRPVRTRYTLPITFRIPKAPEVFEIVGPSRTASEQRAALQRLVVYPPEAREAGIEGRILVRFVLEASGDGQAIAPECAGGPLALCPAALDAVRAFTFDPPSLATPRPGVKARVTVPIDFRLD